MKTIFFFMFQKNCFHFRLQKKGEIEFGPYYTEAAPVSFSPLMIAQTKGAPPAYLGNREA